jgi:hypothetical protein
LDPPVACFPLLVAITLAVIYGNFVDATRMENKKRFVDGTRVDT